MNPASLMTPTPSAPPPPTLSPAPQPTDSTRTDPLWKAAQSLEAGFLSELLRLSDPGPPESGFGGGAGEDQFRSFLFQAQAERMVAAGGIGLAERLYAGLSGRTA